MSPLKVSYRSMASRFQPFAFVELVSPYNKKNITRWLEDMNFMFSWQEQYLPRSLRSLVRYCSCHSNIKFISSRHRVISSTYLHAYFLFPQVLTIARGLETSHRDKVIRRTTITMSNWKQQASHRDEHKTKSFG